MPSYIDFRYPGVFNLNQTPQLPASFGPPNMASMFQSGISALADPIVARMKEEQQRSEAAKSAADYLKTYTDIYGKQQGGGTTGTTGTTTGPIGTPASTRGAAGGSFALGQGMDPSTGEPTEGGTATVPASALLQAGKVGIAGVESGGNYAAIGPSVKGDRAYGKYQVMGSNVGPWTEAHLGRRMSPQEFLADPEAQERVFEGRFGSYLDKYGNLRDAASVWFSGRPYAGNTASDGYNTVPGYVAKMEAYLKNKLGTAPVAPQASFAPTVAPAVTPEARAAVTAPSGPAGAPQQAPAAPYTPDPYRVRPGQGGPIAGVGGFPAAPQGSPQAQAPQQQQQAQQVQVLSAVDRENQAAEAQLAEQRQIGRTKIASLASPQLPRLDLGSTLPASVASPGAPAAGAPSGSSSPAPAAGPPTEVSALDANPVVPRAVPTTRVDANGRPIAPAGATTGSTSPPVPPVVAPPPPPPPPPIQVAQAQGLPPAISGERRGGIDPRMAAALLRNARTPEEVNRIGAALLQSLQPPAPSADRFQIIKDNNGNWVRLDRLSGQVTPMPVGPGTGYREMSSDEKKKFGVPENTGAFIGPDGKPHVLPGTASTKITVTPEAKGEEKFQEETAKSVRKRFDNIVEEGDKAARAKLDLNALSEVFARTGPQGSAANLKTTVGPYLEAVGINVAGLSDAQAVQSIVERMAPQQRVVGTGSQSDAEYRGFLRSLPTLMQSPAARQQVLSMLQAQNDVAVKRAQIIDDHDEGNIDRKTAMQRIRALPSHETVFQQFKKENQELYQQGQRDAGARRDSGNPADLRAVQEQNRAPAQPRSQADYDSLEVGRRYVDPKDGKVYTKGVTR